MFQGEVFRLCSVSHVLARHDMTNWSRNLGQQISSHSFHDAPPPLLDKEILITITTIPQSAGEIDSLLMSK